MSPLLLARLRSRTPPSTYADACADVDAGAEVVGHLQQRRRLPSGRSFIGKGKLEELTALVQLVNASIVIFDHDLTPAQIRNIENVSRVPFVEHILSKELGNAW